jgi:pentatricopeptide repeat protein
MPVSLTISGQYLLYSNSVPDNTMFALVVEACNEANQPKLALEVFSSMEKFGLQPDRRIYSSLIRSFGIHGDVASALGVFEEMKSKFIPDVKTFQSILDVCKTSSENDLLPYNLRLMCSTIDSMEEDGLDLDVYCKDIVMQGFPDAVSLGQYI